MFQDIIRATVQKIFSDKILLGLLIVCLLGFFVGGFNNNNKEEPPVNMPGESEHVAPPTNNQASNQSGIPGATLAPSGPTSNYAPKKELEPALAVDFIKWWMKAAMDYAPKSAAQSHEAASNWMTTEALQAFNEAFWNPDYPSR